MLSTAYDVYFSFFQVGYDVFNDGDDWDMAYRGMAGVGASAYSAYINAQSGCVPADCMDVRNVLSLLISLTFDSYWKPLQTFKIDIMNVN